MYRVVLAEAPLLEELELAGIESGLALFWEIDR
jgi:hypothetical protein